MLLLPLFIFLKKYARFGTFEPLPVIYLSQYLLLLLLLKCTHKQYTKNTWPSSQWNYFQLRSPPSFKCWLFRPDQTENTNLPAVVARLFMFAPNTEWLSFVEKPSQRARRVFFFRHETWPLQCRLSSGSHHAGVKSLSECDTRSDELFLHMVKWIISSWGRSHSGGGKSERDYKKCFEGDAHYTQKCRGSPNEQTPLWIIHWPMENRPRVWNNNSLKVWRAPSLRHCW